MAKMAAVVTHLGEDGKQVQGLFVTLDPRRDTPEVLSQYVPAFHPSFLGLYADEATIAKTADDFKVFHRLAEPDENGYYTVDHSGAIFAFDPQGRLRLYMMPHAPVENMAQDIRQLLRE
jgi:protein SCO1/2